MARTPDSEATKRDKRAHQAAVAFHAATRIAAAVAEGKSIAAEDARALEAAGCWLRRNV